VFAVFVLSLMWFIQFNKLCLLDINKYLAAMSVDFAALEHP